MDREQFRLDRVRVMGEVSDSLAGFLLDHPEHVESDRFKEILWEQFQKVYDENEKFALKPTARQAFNWFYDKIKPGLDATTSKADPRKVVDWLGTALVNAAAVATERRSQKMWLSRRDQKVRPTHVEVDGQKQDWGDPFKVKGYEFDFPGQPVGPPELWLNCRCVVSRADQFVSETEEFDMSTETLAQEDPPLEEEMIPDELDNDFDVEEFDLGGRIPWHGVLVPEDTLSGDGRKFSENALTWRDLPLPLKWQPTDDEQHKGAVLVGSIDNIWRDGNLLKGDGTFLDGASADEVIGQIADGPLRGISVDVDQGELASNMQEDQLEFSKGRISAATIVMIPAFSEVFIALGPWPEGDGATPSEPQVAADLGVEEFKDYTAEQRRELAKKGWALPDGSFPIADCEDLRNAVQAIGRASDPDAAKAHIKKRANSLECEGFELPEGWAVDADQFSSPVEHVLTIPEGLLASGYATTDILPVGDGLKVSRTYAGKNAAQMVKIRGTLWSHALLLNQFADPGLPGEAVGKMSFPVVVDPSIARGIGEADPDQARAKVWSIFRDITFDGVPLQYIFASTPGTRIVADGERIAMAGPALPVHPAPSARNAFAVTAINAALLSHTESFARGPGWITNPVSTKRIHDFWTVPGHKGYAQIRWGTPGDFTRLRRALSKYISPEFLNRVAAQWHHDALGYWPGELGKPGNPPNTKENRRRAARHAASTEEAIVAAADPLPYEWFQNPNLEMPTGLTIDGMHIYGHIAEWETCHVGRQGTCTVAPHSTREYAYFCTGAVVTDQGVISVGNLTMDRGHADDFDEALTAKAHYDNTATVVADVACGEDEFGIWVSGALRAGVTPDEERAILAGAVSGDWRPIGGSLELIAALIVNVPGFPVVRRALVAMAGPEQRSLIITSGLCSCKVDETEESVEELAIEHDSDRAMRALAVREMMNPVRAAVLEEVFQSAGGGQ